MYVCLSHIWWALLNVCGKVYIIGTNDISLWSDFDLVWWSGGTLPIDVNDSEGLAGSEGAVDGSKGRQWASDSSPKEKENETDVYGEHALNENKQMFSFHLKDF